MTISQHVLDVKIQLGLESVVVNEDDCSLLQLFFLTKQISVGQRIFVHLLSRAGSFDVMRNLQKSDKEVVANSYNWVNQTKVTNETIEIAKHEV